ncbi:MAG: cation:proton antiporter [Kiritimatiellia bacterium]|nr:cation:proton antiporter [Kiritimatiellia bacterium]
MSNINFLSDLALVMIAAAIAAVACQVLKQPKAVGYILAGLTLGGLGLFRPLISNQESIHTIADLGLIFLMFSMGIDFNLRKIRNVGVSALVTALIDITVMLSLGFGIGCLLGWNVIESIFLGAIICDSSTTIITKALGDLALKKERFAQIILGATIVEDLLAIVLIALLTGIGLTGSLEANLLFGRIGSLLIFLVMLLIVGLLAVPRLLNSLIRFRDDELLIITVIGICFAVSLLSITLNFSLALGAFIIGSIMAEARQRARIEMLTMPLRDIFGAVFFVAIGLMANPGAAIEHPMVLFLLVAVVMVGKFCACSVGAFVSGNDRPTSVRVGCGMAQVNEFALIIAALGAKMSVTRDFVYALAVGVSLLTTFANPYLLKHSDAVDRAIELLLPSKFRQALARYTARASKRDKRWENDDIIRKTIRRCLIIILINMAWIAGIFIAAAYVARRFAGLFTKVPAFLGGANAVFWFGAALIIVPFMVASLRKLQALAMILAEIRFPQDQDRPGNSTPRLITEWTITIAGMLALALFILMLGSAILPPQKTLVIMAVAVIAIAVAFWKFNVLIYSKAQVALREVFAGNQPWLNFLSFSATQSIFSEAHLADILITLQSPAANKLIRDLSIRALTGATIIGLERESKTLINPSPDEVLCPGDRIYLLGTDAQLDKVRTLLGEQ